MSGDVGFKKFSSRESVPVWPGRALFLWEDWHGGGRVRQSLLASGARAR